MAKRSHLKDYVQGPDGAWEYRGLYWTWDREEERAAFFKRALICLALAAAALIACGFIPPAATGDAPYVLVPYAASAIALVVSALMVYRIAKEGARLRDHIHAANAVNLPGALIAGAVASGIAAVGAVVSVALGAGSLPLGALFALLLGCACGSFVVLRAAFAKHGFTCETTSVTKKGGAS